MNVHYMHMMSRRRRRIETLRSSGTGRFVSSFLLGLGGAGVFVAGKMPEPQVSQVGMASDWKAVGKDMEVAMKRHEREHA